MSCCFEPGQLVVLPAPQISPTQVLSLMPEAGVASPAILYSVEDILHYYHLKIPFLAQLPLLMRVEIGREQESAKILRRFRAIAAATPNYYVRPSLAGPVPNNAYIARSLENSGLGYVDRACGTGVTIAVLDTGVDPSVFERGPVPVQIDTDIPRSATDDKLSPMDPCGHGTVVTTLIRRGAPGATILPIKVMGQNGNLMAVLTGLYAAMAEGWPQIFNLSLSLTCDIDSCEACGQPLPEPPVTLGQVTMLFGHVDTLYEANDLPLPLLVAAAGNVAKNYPITVPARLNHVLAVGSYNLIHPDQVSEYSQYENIPDTSRFIRAPGGEMDPRSCFAVAEGGGNKWDQELFSGTSFATALATAVAARYLCAARGGPCGPHLLANAGRAFIMRCLQQGADRNFAMFEEAVYGLGLLRYQLDVARAIK